MFTDTTTLIDSAIEQLETLRELFADDFSVCRSAGLAQDARQCGEALEAISMLLPRLQRVRAAQEPDEDYRRPLCMGCDD